VSDEKRRLLKLLKEKEDFVKFNKLNYYDPYPFQLEFHNDIETRKALEAGNQIGKTVSGTVQDAFDLTGRYPDWYEGPKYTKPVQLVCGGVNNDKTRDLLQKALCGDPVTKEVSLGTGWLPLDCLDRNKISLKRGVSDAFLHVKVKHHTDGVFDGWSTLSFQSYESGKAAWMGDTVDIFHLDEEPPMDILSQAGRGCIATGGSIRCTYTPENGQTDVVLKIKEEWSLHKAGWPDVAGEDFEFNAEGEVIKFRTIHTIGGKKGHITKKTVDEAAKLFPAYQMKMRMKGIPVLGSGQVFTYSEEQIKILPLDNIPASWPRGSAIDFGGTSDESHPSAVVFGAYDEVNDILYIYDGFRTYGSEMSEVAAKIISRPNSDWIPMFWPHDGGKGKAKNDPAGGTVADKYRRYGVQMFHTHFTNPDEEKGEGKGGIRIEPGITELSGRIFDRRVRVFNTFLEWFEEYRNYHQKDGKIVDKNDDLMAATRYLCQMIRHFVKEKDVQEWSEEEFEETYSGRNQVSGY
jgi:phage terminase large subunit-like protein